MQNTRILLGCIVAIVSLAACKKEATSEENKAQIDNPESPNNLSIEFYFRGTINGVYNDWTVKDYRNGENLPYRYNSATGGDVLGSDCVNTFCKYMIEDVTIFQNNGAGATKNYIAAGFNISSKTGNRSEILSQFIPGLKPFGTPRFTINEPVKNGGYVYYIDENGKEWCTHFGSGIQTNSFFESNELLPQPFSEIYCSNIWRVKFTCNLYDRNGNSIRVENGEIFTPVLVKK
jgi:phage pi2 protein 07